VAVFQIGLLSKPMNDLVNTCKGYLSAVSRMAHLTADQEKYVAEVTTRWQKTGITQVIVTTVRDDHVCPYCLYTADTLIPITDISNHFEHCLNEDGCHCQFRPIVNASGHL
jgi:hypothetical protein